MDILKHISAVPNIHAYLLLQSRGLSALRIRHALLLASASILRAYAASSQQHTQEMNKSDTLHYKVDISALAKRLDFSPTFTMQLVDQLAPAVVARLQRRLRGDRTLLAQFNEPTYA